VATAIDNRLMSKKEGNCFHLSYASLGLPLFKKQENRSLPKPSSAERILLSHLLFPRNETQLSGWRKGWSGNNGPIVVVVLDCEEWKKIIDVCS